MRDTDIVILCGGTIFFISKTILVDEASSKYIVNVAGTLKNIMYILVINAGVHAVIQTITRQSTFDSFTTVFILIIAVHNISVFWEQAVSHNDTLSDESI